MRNSKTIENKIREYKAFSKNLFREIKQAQRIGVFAHSSPDPDAFGSQFGLGVFLKEHFPTKDIVIVGESHEMYSGSMYPYTDNVDDSWFQNPFLAIAVDTATRDRVSNQNYKLATTLIKIDHHPNVDPYGDYSLVDPSSVAVSEILSVLLLGTKKRISPEVASYLYSGIVGDSGRFRYASTTALTFSIAALLVNLGVNINDVYSKIYVQEESDLIASGYILSNYKVTPNGFAYYCFSDETQQKLKISADRAKEHVNIFSGVKGVKAWASFTERKENNEWRVSLRSGGKPIDHIALKWRGGGHPQASGATLLNKAEIEAFIAELDEYIKA